MPSNPLILCHPLLILPSVFPNIRVFSTESALRMRWPKYWSFSFSVSPSDEDSGLISFRMDWFDLLAVQETLKSLLQHHSSKASILRHSAFFMVQLLHPYMTIGKTIALTRQKNSPIKIPLYENTCNNKCTKRVTELRTVTEGLFIYNNDNKESLSKMIDSCSQNVALKMSISKLTFSSPLAFIAILEYFQPLNNRVWTELVQFIFFIEIDTVLYDPIPGMFESTDATQIRRNHPHGGLTINYRSISDCVDGSPNLWVARGYL